MENRRVSEHKNTQARVSTAILPIPIQFVNQITPADVKKVGKYKIVGTLGEGGFGKVYLAWDEDIKNYVALKKGKLKYMQKELDFLQEPTFAKNCHRFLCVHDGFKYKGAAYIVTDLITGTPLDMVPGRVWRSSKAKGIVKQIYEQIRFLHDEARIVHRDLSTRNMLFDSVSNRITFVDFGISCQNKKGKKFRCSPGGYAADIIQPKDSASRWPKTERQFEAADIYMSGKSLQLAIKESRTSLSRVPSLVRQYIRMATTYNAKERLKRFYKFKDRL
jgi:serine/threonine protein kinase